MKTWLVQNLKITLALLGLLAAAGVWAGTDPRFPDLDAAAREHQVQAARLVMQNYRKEVTAAAKASPPEDRRYEQAIKLVVQGERLVHRMVSASPAELAQVQVAFDANRAALDRELGREPAKR
ncbi:MAG: hypothetical protein NDI75_03435 [Candidatus Didemnitutus sp.]|jgi:hypothetical protein|nr:hypothetical protein [Candidatus Didemnitutus sp.]